MAYTNLDKYYEIEDMMADFKSVKDSYLDTLKDRHDYMNEYRAEYKRLVRTINDIKRSIKKNSDTEEERKVLLKSSRKQIDAHIEHLKELQEQNTYEDYERSIKAMELNKDKLNDNARKESIEEVRDSIKRTDLKIEELDILIDSEEDYELSEEIEDITTLISTAEDDYLSSFKEYRKACEESDEVYDAFNDIFEVLLDIGLDYESEKLSNALPDVEETRKKRPDPTELLNILKPIRSAGLLYWQSKYKNSDSYSLNKTFANEVAYSRRALLEDREYNGTKNAFERLENAYIDLKNYMYERYHQLGGTPNNYHGHDSRI
ncbi:hypothetical protein [Staphylococcus pasteuri]|uniref:hypothetical protein n=1 Tax=Staphylococcus pasteuri TaxID=45972 RepID=UPI002DBC2BC1|nr:hypothetical protein [Staphylococcus pasteuri]MEB7435748.1 hypothetical protein [Staphylococcus pasteuri]